MKISKPVRSGNPCMCSPLFEGCSSYPHAENDSVSERLFTTGLCLPSGTNMSDDGQQRVITCVRKRLRG